MLKRAGGSSSFVNYPKKLKFPPSTTALYYFTAAVHLNTALHYVFRSIVALHSFRLKLGSYKYLVHWSNALYYWTVEVHFTT